jgi:hypothetical protein
MQNLHYSEVSIVFVRSEVITLEISYLPTVLDLRF